MNTFLYHVNGIPPFACEGKGMLVTGEEGSALICTDQGGTAAQNVEGFVPEIRKWLSENGHEEASDTDVYLYYPKETSIYGKEYFLHIEANDSLGNPMTRAQLSSVLGCAEKDLPSSN